MSVDRTISGFVRALRSADVRVSPAETLDAMAAVRLLGWNERARLRTGLRSVLAKNSAEQEQFDRLFDLYFTREKPQQQADQESDPPQGKAEQQSSDEEQQSEVQSLSELALPENSDALEIALETAGRAAQVQNIRFSTQVAFYAQKMLKEMGIEQLERELLDALKSDRGEGRESDELIAARRFLTRQAIDFVQREFDVFGAGETERFREDVLTKKRIGDLDRSDLERMKPVVEKIAKKLAVKYNRQRMRARKGVLDVRKTLRKNAGKDGVPFDVFWKRKRRDRPKLILICDVSGSVARYVRFLLLLMHSLKDVAKDIETYAFSSRLMDVSSMLDTAHFETAMDQVVREAGWGSTDYGQALSDLKVKHWSELDRRSTVIVLGDGRSNYGDPRTDIFSELASRTKRVLWLNPEGRSSWGSGDSVAHLYEPYCANMSHIRTITDLERAIDDALSHY